MALKATIHKAQIQLADMDRNLYTDLAVTIARHPSETDERMMLRLLALALHTPSDDTNGRLELAGGLSDVDEPALWHKDLTGRILHWIELGQPDDKRLLRACGRADRVTVLAYGASTPIWWSGIAGKLVRARNLAVWSIPAPQSAALAQLAQRGMQLQVTVQDGAAWVGDGTHAVELQPQALLGGT